MTTKPLPEPVTPYCVTRGQSLNTLRPEQNGWHFADNIFKWIPLNEAFAYGIIIQIALKGPIDNMPAFAP